MSISPTLRFPFAHVTYLLSKQNGFVPSPLVEVFFCVLIKLCRPAKTFRQLNFHLQPDMEVTSWRTPTRENTEKSQQYPCRRLDICIKESGNAAVTIGCQKRKYNGAFFSFFFNSHTRTSVPGERNKFMRSLHIEKRCGCSLHEPKINVHKSHFDFHTHTHFFTPVDGGRLRTGAVDFWMVINDLNDPSWYHE